MPDNLESLRTEVEAAIAAAASLDELQAVEARFVGRSGSVTALMKTIGTLPPEQRPAFGQRVNRLRDELAGLMAERRAALEESEVQRRRGSETIDITLPGRVPAVGRRHPLTRTFERVSRLMVGLGYEQVDGPELEEYEYNFQALNFPQEHPALDEHMSLYVTDDLLLRTHTTATQGRFMPALDPPFRLFTLGRCFRSDAVDATHFHTFHQLDAFMVDRRVSMADLKGTLETLVREMFGADAVIRFRPDFFPFVEPGAELAVRQGDRWLELGGAGMIHPNVLRHVGIDPEEWTGFAFGLGLDRMANVRHGISDIRVLFENDLRVLTQL